MQIRNRLLLWVCSVAMVLMLLLPGTAVAAIEDCAKDGGMAICTQPVVVASSPASVVDADQWAYNLCDENPPYLGILRIWCEVRGGTWNVEHEPVCIGAGPVLGPLVVPYSTEFEKRLANACTMNLNDSGWGATVSSYNCYTGAPVRRNGVLIGDLRQMNFTGFGFDGYGGCTRLWAGTVYGARSRSLACPTGYSTRSKPNGDLECWYLPPCCTSVGNPINVITGAKRQDELDYRSGMAGGLELVRSYNSIGFFQIVASPARVTDYWRTNWDRRILAEGTSAVILAHAQRPDGGVKVFLADGSELHKTAEGGADVLVKLVDNTGTLAGWQLTTGASDIETYDAMGRLLWIRARTGYRFTLAYDGNGLLATVTDSLGRRLVFAYDRDGRMSSATLPDNGRVQYDYNAAGALEAVRYPDGTVRTYLYENAARPHELTGIVDENGQRFATYTYDPAGRALTSQHAGGADRVSITYFSYGPTGGFNSVTDALNTVWMYSYQAAGGVLRVSDMSQQCSSCTNAHVQTSFDPNGNIVSRTDFNGNRTTYTYDLARNLELSRTEAAGTALARTIATQWHPAYRLPTRLTAPSPVAGSNTVTDYVYDRAGNLTQRTITGPANDGTGATTSRTWKRTYTTLGRVTTAADPNGNVTVYGYYADDDPDPGKRGNVATVTNPLGQVTQVTAYDANGRPLATVDPNGLVTTLTYHPRGWLASRTVGGERTRYDYDGVGQLTAVTLPDGSMLAYAYDAAHRLTQVADGLGNQIIYTLDAAGNRVREDVYDHLGALARTRSRTFDGLGRLAADIGAQLQTTTYRYDGNGNLLTTTDPLTRQTANVYDAFDRVRQATDPAGGVTRYAYDAAGNLTQVTDPRMLATTYIYDGLGNMVQQVSPDTGATRQSFDAAGNMAAKVDARGVTARYAYDRLDRVTGIAYGRSGSPTETHSFEYDGGPAGAPNAVGRLTKLTDTAATTRWSYTAQGRVATKSQQVGGLTQTVAYRYNAAGQRTGVTTPSGQVLGYRYLNNRISGITVNGVALIASAVATPFGPVGAWQWGNSLYTFRDYDGDGRLEDWEFRNGSSVLRNEVSWDQAGRITAIVDPANGAHQGTYQYDALDRLITAYKGHGLTGTQQFSYDAVGNRIVIAVDAAVTGLDYGATNNRLLVLYGALTPDPLHGDADRLFTYNLANRMVELRSDTGTQATYQVNALAQRIGKTVNGSTTRFVYDEQGHLLGEYDIDGKLIQETVWLDDLPVATLRPKPGSISTPVQVDIYYVHADHLGTPRAITRPNDNTIMWRWDNLDAFGANAPEENPGGAGVFTYALRFPGQYYDAETRTHYNYFRDYDPAVGRYEQSDPIGLRGGLDTYAYVASDPVSTFDPKGFLRWPDLPPIGSKGCGPGGGRGIPDVPLLTFNFRSCCFDHDDCYDDCKNKPTKEQCDTTFCVCLVAECNKHPEAAAFCLGLAGIYCSAAVNMGQLKRQCDGPCISRSR